MKNKEHIGVVYLMWLPLGVELFLSFINSYASKNAGMDHHLIICFNGVDDVSELSVYDDLIKKKNILAEIHMMKKGQDIEVYRNIARGTSMEYLLFFNTYSVILSDNWLIKYFNAITRTPSTGIVAGTASFQSYYSSVFQKNCWQWQKYKGVGYNFRKYKLFAKAFLYWRFLFKSFPNPHLRTNAFMVRREEFINMKESSLKSKFDAYRFESGYNSLTNYYLKKGLKALVVDKNGSVYEPHQWKDSLTFWISNQDNLLVSDNQTTIYDKANTAERKSMTKLAWGINE